MYKTKSGFTIVELLIVIVVIGILAAITIVAFNGIQDRARDTRRVQDMNSIVKALEVYKIQNGNYPAAVSTPNAGGWEVSTNGTTATNFINALVTSGVTSSIPVDPRNTGDISTTSSLTPKTNSDNWLYFYHRYAAGNGSCNLSGGDFYVLGVTRLDSVPLGQHSPDSPGFSCPGRDWALEGAWVTGAFTN